MAQFYTLEEAARVLGMGPEELKDKAQSREVRAFMDGGSWRFRVADVDELARRRGLGSDPDLSLSDVDLLAKVDADVYAGSGSDFDLSEFHLGTVDAHGLPGSAPLLDSVTDRDILLDDLNLPPNPMASSKSTIIGLEPSGKSDLIPTPRGTSMPSDVRVVPRTPAPGPSPSLSDVQPVLPEFSTSSQSDVRPLPAGLSDVRPSPRRPGSSDVRPSWASTAGPSDSDVRLAPDDLGVGDPTASHIFSADPSTSHIFLTAAPPKGGPAPSSTGEIKAPKTGSGSGFAAAVTPAEPSSGGTAAMPQSGEAAAGGRTGGHTAAMPWPGAFDASRSGGTAAMPRPGADLGGSGRTGGHTAAMPQPGGVGGASGRTGGHTAAMPQPEGLGEGSRRTGGHTAAMPEPEDLEFPGRPGSTAKAPQPDTIFEGSTVEEGSDFELSALEGSDEFDVTPTKKPGDSDITGFEPGASGINLGRPSDSGINLQSVGAFGFSGIGRSGLEPNPISGDELKLASDEMSATALPVSQETFDDTDFDVDATPSDHDDRTVQLDAASDFDLAEEVEEIDSSSTVLPVEDEVVDVNAATTLGSAPALEEAEDSGVKARSSRVPAASSSAIPSPGDLGSGAWDIAPEAPSTAAARVAGPAPVLASTEARNEWGGIWVGFLMVATVVVLLLSFVSMDLLHNMYGFRDEMPIGHGLAKQLSSLVAGG